MSLFGSQDDLDGGLIEPRSNDRWPRGVTCDGGFRLLGTQLGFEGSSNAGLLFYSDLDQQPPPGGKRILGTTAAALAIGADSRGLDVLGLDPERKVRLGRMDIRLLSSGVGVGASILEVVYRSRSIVFCSGVRFAVPLHSSPVQVPRCDLLLLDAPAADPRPPSPRTASRELAAWTRERVANGVAVVACGSVNAAIDAAWTLSSLGEPITATRPLFEILRRLETIGYSFPTLLRLNQEWPAAGVVLHYRRLWPRSPFFRRTDAVAYAGPGRTPPAWAAAAFRLGEREDRPGLLAFVKQTGASQVALGPRCDAAMAPLLRKAGVDIRHLTEPTQIPLPI
jgi:hypothetical protein